MPSALESMHPLIYPAAAPASTGTLSAFWWLLAVPLAVLVLLGALWLSRRSGRKPAPATVITPASQFEDALNQLQQLPRPRQGEQAGPWLQQLNLLLKRFCAVRYPDVASHRLSGREWLAFLDSRCPAAGLTRWMILVQGSYLPDCRLSQAEIEELYNSLGIWMRAHA